MPPPSVTGPGRGRLGAWLGLLPRHPVTAGIFAATAAVFALQFLLGGTTDPEVMVRLGALVPERVRAHGELFRLLTPMLLHMGWIHFGFNMFAFLQLGILTEHFFGRSGLLATYVLSGAGAALCTALLAPAWLPASVGASGAILGLAGLLLGVSWYGREPWRGTLRRLLGRSLWASVAITFALGLGVALVMPLIDNWGHLGGLVTGLTLAGVHRLGTFGETPPLWPGGAPNVPHEGGPHRADRQHGGASYGDLRSRRDRPEIPRSLLGAADPRRGPVPTPWSLRAVAVAGLACWVGAVGWMGVAGADALESYERDLAASLEARALSMKGGIRSAMAIARAVDVLEEQELPEESLQLLHRTLPHLLSPDHYALVVQQLEELGHHRAALEVVEVLLDEDESSDALNLAAWHLVTAGDPALRDAGRAEALSRRSLALLDDERPPADPAAWRMRRSAYLDTLAEALIQQGRFAEAEPYQREAVSIAEDDGLDVLDELTARMRRIERALGGRG